MGDMFDFSSQERMPIDIVPLPEKRKPVYKSFAEMFESEFIDDEWRLNWIMQVQRFETLNAITKKDLQAALRWIFNQHYTITKG